MPAQIKIEGLDKLLKKFDSLEGLQVVKAGIQAGALQIKRKLATYPPRRPESTYRRTMALQHRWTIKTRDAGLTAIVGNLTPYGPFVQDRERQAWMHKSTWKTTDDVAEQEGKRVEELVVQAVEKALAK